MLYKQILEKWVDLEKACLSGLEKKEMIDMLYKYEDTFSLKVEMGACPIIEVEIDVTDKFPFFITPYHVQEEDKAILDKEMKRLCYLDNYKRTLFSIFKSTHVISRKSPKRKG